MLLSATLGVRLCARLTLLLLELGLLIVVRLGAADRVDRDERRSLVDVMFVSICVIVVSAKSFAFYSSSIF